MQTATDLDRVAVEPLGKYLVLEFGEEAIDDRFKQFIGHIARQIMEAIGYKHDRKSLQNHAPGSFQQRKHLPQGAEIREPNASFQGAARGMVGKHCQR
jgi:hypothetical protein